MLIININDNDEIANNLGVAYHGYQFNGNLY